MCSNIFLSLNKLLHSTYTYLHVMYKINVSWPEIRRLSHHLCPPPSPPSLLHVCTGSGSFSNSSLELVLSCIQIVSLLLLKESGHSCTVGSSVRNHFMSSLTMQKQACRGLTLQIGCLQSLIRVSVCFKTIVYPTAVKLYNPLICQLYTPLTNLPLNT